MPSAWLSWYLPVNARSVPLWRVTSNDSGVSCCFHSFSGFSIFSTSTTPFRRSVSTLIFYSRSFRFLQQFGKLLFQLLQFWQRIRHDIRMVWMQLYEVLV